MATAQSVPVAPNLTLGLVNDGPANPPDPDDPPPPPLMAPDKMRASWTRPWHNGAAITGYRLE